ncbi:AAA family ATPase [Methylobacterium sp. WL6]|uniref:AAA family ATPase n=1 Tax=Methylobacterium sp. WL6 TaxID=2603901 RepID=UPI0011CBDC81|nr:AAA family ATPase [Methylobacterium sp. WL6]TXN72197.1 AAA family ATPase [Methylobacterium sp. WL6]
MTAETVERLTIQVASVIWSSETATIFSGITPRRETVRVVAKGEAFRPVGGEVYRMDGRWHESVRHGLQFYARPDGFVRMMPSGKLVVPWLQTIEGLGPARAKRIVQALRGRLDGLLDGSVTLDQLAEIIDPERPNLAARLAVAVFRTLAETSGEYETVRWLEEQGVEDGGTVRRVLRLFGPEALPLLQRNPYVLSGPLPWPKVDPLALRILEARDDITDLYLHPARIVGAIDAVMLDAIREGDTAVHRSVLGTRVAKKLARVPEAELEEEVVRVGVANHALVELWDLWRSPGCAVLEEDLLVRFRSLAAGGERTGVKLPSAIDLRRLLAMVENQGRSLHPEQRDAVLAIMGRPLACLTGGAGTGKTATCRAVVDLWEHLGGHVQMAALSGKAALRLTEGTGRIDPGQSPAVTIHRLILGLEKRMNGQTHWGGTGHGKAPIGPAMELPQLTNRTLLVIDEASMVDLGQMHRLVDAMPRGCRLLLVGDAFQLPPVGFGLVFHHLVEQRDVTSRLETVHRQSDGSGIPAVSREVRACRIPDLPAYGPGRSGVSFLAAEAGEVSEAIERVVADIGGHDRNSGGLMVLSAVNTRGAEPDGTVRHLNHRLHHAHVASLQIAACGPVSTVRGYMGNEFCVGDPVTFMRNDYEKGLRNGSLGHVTAIDEDLGTVTCQFDGETVTLTDRDLFDLSLAYAVSCHRAQGSQARSVVVSLIDARNMDPTWVYTALTRAEESVVLVGPWTVLKAAMSRPPAHARRLVGCTFDLTGPDDHPGDRA